MKRVVFLVSGGGGNLKFTFHALRQLNLPVEIAGVISDRECAAVEFAVSHNIQSFVLANKSVFQAELRQTLTSLRPDIVVTNIHKIIEPENINLEKIDFINLHYSLLPAYGGVIGMKTVEMARNENAQFLGTTCHVVEEVVDGGKILSQTIMPVDWASVWEETLDLVFKTGCLNLFGTLLRIAKIEPGDTTPEFRINDVVISFNPPIPRKIIAASSDIWDNLK